MIVPGAPAAWYFYFFDALGNVVALADENANIVEAYSYDVFGAPTLHTAPGLDAAWLTPDDTTAPPPAASTIANPCRFTARRYDPETGLYHYRARYYDPTTGRFLQPDPISYDDGMNLYAYVGNNPARFTDPTGASKWDRMSWDEKLGQGYYYGTGYAEESAEKWAEWAAGSDSWYGYAFYAAGGTFTQLWQPDTYQETGFTLGAIYYLGKSIERPKAPAREYRHDTPPSKPHYDKNTGKPQPDHWHVRDHNWSPKHKKWIPGKWKYHGPRKPPGAPGINAGE